MRTRLRPLCCWAVSAWVLLAAALCPHHEAGASPWVEVGDAGLRRDIEILAGHRLIDGLVTTWPLPWAQVARALTVTDASAYPEYVQQALSRVRARFRQETETHRVKGEARVQATNKPPLVRDFGRSVYDELQAQVSGEYLWESTAARLSVGYLGRADLGNAKATLDRSYLAQELDNWLLYAGLLQQWWGPGNISSLILSNNPRPMPHVGIMRNNPKAFESPWLSWIGPWQFNGFLGYFNDERTINDVLFVGLRAAFSPVQGLEIGVNRTLQLCGEGRPCGGKAWKNAFLFVDNNPDDPVENPSNQMAGADIRYTVPIDPVLLSVYGQYTGEDQRSDLPNKAGWVLGTSVTGHSKTLAATWQVIFEASDSRASLYSTADTDSNVFYTGVYFPEGYRYRGRALGHSLDNDARLYSLKTSFTDADNRSLYFAYHFADLNRDGVAAGNTVSDSADAVNIGQVGIAIPWGSSMLSLDLTVQDDQPNTPDEKSFLFSALAAWNARF